jgi:hypothetical protein
MKRRSAGRDARGFIDPISMNRFVVLFAGAQMERPYKNDPAAVHSKNACRRIYKWARRASTFLARLRCLSDKPSC